MSEPTPKGKANRRGAARLAAVQALYQMDIAGKGLNDILAEFESHWLGQEVEGETFAVLIIPHTLKVTTLDALRVGDRVNLEVDQMARYAARLMEGR